jgi:circadian clock protein KaiB
VAERQNVRLLLFVADGEPRTFAAIQNIGRALESFHERAFLLEIVNVFDEPERAMAERVLVTPTLLAPESARRLVGDLSESSMVNYFLQSLR